MSILQERLMSVLTDTGRVAIAQTGLLARLQERWPTPHGYAPQSVDAALKVLQTEGVVHCSPAGKWTRYLNLARAEAPLTIAPLSMTSEDTELIVSREFDTEAPAADDDTTQEIEVAEKTKICKGKCGEEKPIGDFYTNCSSCKRCVLDRQRELKAAKGGKPVPKAAKVAKPAKAAPAAKSALKNLKAKAAAVKKSSSSTPPHGGNGRIVAISFALRIEDVHGVFHELSVAKTTVTRLVAELKEYA